MKQNNCDLFFTELAKQGPSSVKVLLLGGSAAQIYGGVRPTLDVDFEALLMDKTQAWEDFEAAVHRAEQITGIGAQFSENVERWSQISYLDYHKHLRKYKNFQKIAVYLLDPYYWSIGKITRYLDSDIQDMVQVFKKEKVEQVKLAKLWHKALTESPRSTELFIMKKNVIHFFDSFAASVWGRTLDREKIKKIGF